MTPTIYLSEANTAERTHTHTQLACKGACASWPALYPLRDSNSPPSSQSKHQKHQAFEAELHANADRIRGVIDTGNSLIQRGACAGSEDAVKVTATSRNPHNTET